MHAVLGDHRDSYCPFGKTIFPLDNMSLVLYVPGGLGHFPIGKTEAVDSTPNTTPKTQRDEAESLLRRLIRKDVSWASDWQIEEVVQGTLSGWFDRDVNESAMERQLAQLRQDLEAAAPFPDFGNWLREQLEQRRWSQSDLARKIESHPSLVSKWIRGLQRPQPLQCRRLSSALRVDYEEVLSAAGHYWPINYENLVNDTIAENSMRNELLNLISDIPEPLLIPLVPMLRAMAQPDTAASTLVEMNQALRRTQLA